MEHPRITVADMPHGTLNEQTPPPAMAQHKLLDQVVRTPGRQPSPQPTMLGVPGAMNSNQSLHKILADNGPGYVAPKFEGKQAQMEEGEYRSWNVHWAAKS